MFHLYSINLLKCFCSIVNLLILCSHVFVNVSEKYSHTYTCNYINVFVFQCVIVNFHIIVNILKHFAILKMIISCITVFVTGHLFVLPKDKIEKITVLNMNEVYVFELILLLIWNCCIFFNLKSFQSLVLVSRDSV